MTVSMTKGQKIHIQKDNGNFQKANFGLKWKVKPSNVAGADFDLDFFMVLLNSQGMAAYGNSNDSLIFYNHPENPTKSVYVLGDNLVGGSGEEGKYDEQGFVEFNKVPAEITQIVACVSIYEYNVRKQNFGQVTNARCDILNGDTKQVLATYDLTEDMSAASGIVVGRFRREADNTWSFKAVGEAVMNGMEGLITPYGMSV